MADSLKIDVVLADVDASGVALSNYVTKDVHTQDLSEKADLVAGKVKPEQLPAFTDLNGVTAAFSGLETTLRGETDAALIEAKTYADNIVANVTSSKADLVSGRVPADQATEFKDVPGAKGVIDGLKQSFQLSIQSVQNELRENYPRLENNKIARINIPNDILMYSEDLTQIRNEFQTEYVQFAADVNQTRNELQSGYEAFVVNSDERYAGKLVETEVDDIIKNGASLPYNPSIQYLEGSIVRKDGELKQLIDGEWVKTSCIFIDNVSDFVKIKPFVGLTVILTKYEPSVTTGGGLFECKSGVLTADGGHVFASNESGYYFERLSNDVNLFDYGIKIQDVATTRSVGAVDYYQKLVAAIARAKSTNKPLVSPFSLFNDEFTTGASGVYISQGIDISGLKILQGSLTLFIKGSVFTPILDLGTNTDWVLLNKNARYDVDGKQYNSSTQGRQSIESISIVNVNERTTVPNLHGQLHTTAHSNIKGTLSSYKLGARGVWLASTYDSSFVDVKVNQCGNLDFFAYDTAGYAPFVDTLDETNAITVSNLMVHDSYDRAMNLRGAKNTYSRIHEEKTIVTTNRGGVPDYYSPYGYHNSFVNLVGGAIVEWQSDAKDVAEHLYPVVNVVVMADTDVGALYTHERLIVHTTNNPPNTFGGDINTINCNELYVVANAKASIGNCRVAAKTVSGKYSLPGNVTILDTTSSIDILQYEGAATVSGGVLNKVTGGNLTANNCGITKANVAALVVTGSDSSIGTVNATSLNINAGHIGHATISANATVSGGEISKLICATLTHSGGVISSGSSSGNITSTGGAVNNFASQGAAALGGEGNYTRVTLDNAANSVLTLTGAPVLRACSTASNVVVSAGTGLPAKMDRCYVAGSLSMNDNSNLAVKDSRVDGQLNLGGASIKFSSINTPFGNLSTFGTGYWTFINCKFSATAGNWIFGNDITNPIGFMSQHPVTKELFICTATGWKQITHA